MDAYRFRQAVEHVFTAHAESSHLVDVSCVLAERYRALSPHPKGFSARYSVFASALASGVPDGERVLDLLIKNRIALVTPGSGNSSGIDRSCSLDDHMIEWHARYAPLSRRETS